MGADYKAEEDTLDPYVDMWDELPVNFPQQVNMGIWKTALFSFKGFIVDHM